MSARPEIVIIAALAESNRVIGKNGALPWHISDDLKRFKRLTVGHTVLMGRKTFESILQRNGRPLADRRNLVLSSGASYPDHQDVEIFQSMESALATLDGAGEVFVIGGERVFAAALLKADRLELTIVEDDYGGDAFFPEYEYLIGGRFRLTERDEHDGFRFESYQLAK